MILVNNRKVLIYLLLLLNSIQLGCSLNRPAPKKTGLLQPVEGYTGELIGAEVTSVSPVPDNNMVEIVVSVPQPLDDIETVNIVNKEGKKIKSAKSFEFSKDADGEPNGVIIYLEKSRRLPFRLKFNVEQPEY